MNLRRGGETDASRSGLRSSPARSLRALALERTVASCWYWGERLFVVLVLSTYAGSLMAVLATVSSGSSESTRRLALLFAFLFAGLVALSHPAAFLRTLSRHVWTGLLVLLALASTAWSADPGLTLKRALMLLGTTLLGVCLATRFRPREILALLAVTMGGAALMSMAFGLLDPGRGIAQGVYEGDWRGLYGHKNALGLFMGLGTIVFVLTARAAAKRRTLLWILAGLCFALVLLSRSATSLVATTGVLVLLPLLYVLRERSIRTMLVSILMLLILGSIAMVVSLNLEAALHVVGKDTTLTGRVPLWKFLLDRVQDRPWLGAGYSAFWMGWSGPSEFVSNVTGGWYPSHAHNGLLNLALQLGGVGVVLFVLGMATAGYRALRSLREGPPEGGIFSLSMLGFLALTSMSESTLLAHDSLFWLLYTVAVFLPISTSGSSPRLFARWSLLSSRTIRVAPQRGSASLGVKRRLRKMRPGGRMSDSPPRAG